MSSRPPPKIYRGGLFFLKKFLKEVGIFIILKEAGRGGEGKPNEGTWQNRLWKELYTCPFIYSIQQDGIATEYWLYFHISLLE